MTSEAHKRVGFFTGLCIVFLTLFGTVVTLVSLGNWFSDVLASEPVSLGRGKVIGFSDREPYDTTSRRNSYMDYPVVEYRDEFGKRGEISDRRGFRGHFKIGEEVSIGKRDDRVFVVNFWFRAHGPIMGALGGLMTIGFVAFWWHKLRSP